ncbi:hypothetical protein L3Q82_009154 [Scortum barcoo]|uniref:Uncharacterized protein n=1 Tax=Scortum barcoo TaxID=214431 RepID=A0ACB8XAX7_9TELE|nr:hypothetical protein L3Q82_009154 [Scortum barcoo]
MKEILEAFPSQDHAKDLEDLDLEADALPMQRSLSLLWDLKKDSFTLMRRMRRGVLSTINSLYDPLGFVAPVTIHGKSILRELTVDNSDWDAPLPPKMEESWVLWRDSLSALSKLLITRTYTDISPSEAARRELCIFCDASTKAIAAVAYLKVTDAVGNCEIGFVMDEQTIPRLELCAVVLAVELADLVSGELDIQLNDTHFYTDSVHILIAVGSVMMVVGFLGCYGAIQESQCLLGTFFACLVILFACEVAAGIWGFMHKDTVSKEMINFYDSVYDKAIAQSLGDKDKKKAAASVLKVFHETLSCCGKGQGTSLFTQLTDVFGLTDFCPSSGATVVSVIIHLSSFISTFMPPQPRQTSCHHRIKELFSDKIYLIGIAALVVAVIMVRT